MSRRLTVAVTLIALVISSSAALVAQRASRGSVSRSGGSSSWQGQRASGSQDGEPDRLRRHAHPTGPDAGRWVADHDQGSGRREPRNRQDDHDHDGVGRVGHPIPRGRGAGRLRDHRGERQHQHRACGLRPKAVAGRTYTGQPAVAGTVNTKYNGTYNAAAARTPYGGWNTAVAGPYGGRVTTTLPSGYRTATYYGRPYYTYGGAYYRPYTYGGVHYYYPVPPPYYSYYSYPPPGATMLMIAGVKYLMSQDGSYSKQTTTSDGKTAYQSVPAPQGATIATLPATRVLVTVAGTTYYLNANAFYRRVMNGAQESFVVVTAPAGVVFVAALPANFEVVQLNTMYFMAGGRYYVPYLAPDGGEKYVMVDTPPSPPSGTGARRRRHGAQAHAPEGARSAVGCEGSCIGAGRDARATCGRTCPCGRGTPRGPCRHGPGGPTGDRGELRDRAGRQSFPGLSRPGPRRQRPHDRTARRQGVRRGERGGCGQQDEGPPDVERHADGHAGRRPRACRSRRNR